jgi:ATP-dependent Clp protease protease subunit
MLTSLGGIAYYVITNRKKQKCVQEKYTEKRLGIPKSAYDAPEFFPETIAATEHDGMASTNTKNPTSHNQTTKEPSKATQQPKTDTPNFQYDSILSQPATIHHSRSVFLPEIPDPTTGGSFAFNILQNLFLQTLSNKPEEGNIKLFLGSESAVLRDGFSWLGDMLPLLGKPVDVIASSKIGKTGLSTLVNTGATGGKAFMMPNAKIILYASNNITNRTQAHFQIQTEKRLSDQSLNSLATLIMHKSGEKNREQVLQDLKTVQGDKTWNALQALYYGESGLIDGILIKGSWIITRPVLERYLVRNRIKTPEQIEDFLKDPANIEKIPAQRIADVFPESISSKAMSNYTPINPAYMKEKPQKEQEVILYRQSPKNPTTLLDSSDTGEGVSNVIRSSIPKRLFLTEKKSDSFAFDIPGAKHKSILMNDNIFYGEAVSPKLIGELSNTLIALNDKKTQQGSTQHIQLYLQSPGGSIDGEKMFMDSIQSINTPVDIIAVGLVASAAASMLVGATGLRLALPQASIMIHEPSLNVLGDMSSEYFEDNAKLISYKTGRPFKEVLEDQKREYYMNPLEALCYGPKGFIDGIPVDGQHIITRKEVVAYLVEKLGSKKAAEHYIEEKLFQLRNPSLSRHQRLNDEKDPFSNPVHTIQEIAKRNTKTLGHDQGYERSGADIKGKYFEQINICEKPQIRIDVKLGSQL